MRDMQNSKRNSAIELLKVAAIIMIVISHAVPVGSKAYGDVFGIASATRDKNVFVAVLLRNLGQIGNDVFLICSAWFLIECNEVRSRKILYMIMDCFLVSVFWLGIFIVFGWHFPPAELLRQFFPIMFGNNWYITCYLLLYLIHPLLNIIIRKCFKKQLLVIVCIVIILYFGIAFLYEQLIFYNRFIGAIGLYLVVAYIKRYLNRTMHSKRVQMGLLVIGVSGWLVGQFLTNNLGLYIAALKNHMLHWNHFNNPFFMCIGLSVFYMAECHAWQNRVVNYLASLSLLIYIMTENYLFKNYVSYNCFVKLTAFFGTGDTLAGSILLFALILLLGGAFASMLYRCTIRKVAVAFCNRLDVIGHKAANCILTVLLRAE